MKPLRRMKRQARRARRVVRGEFHATWRRAPIRPNTVLYESFSGNGMLDNPEAIFRHLLSHPDHSRLTHVWAVRDPGKHQGEFADHKRVRFVRHGSAQYFKELALAGYLVNNATFPAQFSKRPGQVYVNTWHGTPLKRMGYGMPNGAGGTRNIVRNFLAADYLLSSSPFMTDQMYATDYKMRNIYPGQVLQEGFPRTDVQFRAGAGAAARAALVKAGLQVGDDRVIVYAPTWKGPSFHRPEARVEELAAALAAIGEGLGSGWTVLAKTHQAVFDQAADSPELAGRLIPNDIPTNLVLAGADAVVTDYSSILFDYLPLRRPLVFYIPDRAEYEGSRGLYRPPGELPGRLAQDPQELTEAIAQVTDPAAAPPADVGARHAEWLETFAPHEDGSVTDRVVDAVWGGTASARSVDISSDGREKLLIYLGPMKSNGITMSSLNMLRNIDHDRFDVSAFYLHSHRRDQVRNARRIDPAVRHLPRVGGMNGSKLLHLRRHAMQRRGVPDRVSSPDRLPAASVFQGEWERCFGAAEFDYILDFSGYGPLWDLIFLQGKARTRSIWLHNDMYADARREVNGNQHLLKKLHSVFSTYRFFDNLVSVSKELSDVNAARLAEFAPGESFTYAHNTIDHQTIRARAALPLREELRDGEPAEGVEEDEWVLEPARPGVVTFVTVGRLSTEKNQERLIRAFARVHSDEPDTRLLIVGSGPLEDRLRRVIESLDMQDAVQLAGFQPNPYPIMAVGDCFVMSSDHEGQPIVILEALTLGLPVLITDFSSSRGALPKGTGLIVERSVDGLVEGLRTFLADGLPNPRFDPVDYNASAMGEFYRAIGADPRPRDMTGPTPGQETE